MSSPNGSHKSHYQQKHGSEADGCAGCLWVSGWLLGIAGVVAYWFGLVDFDEEQVRNAAGFVLRLNLMVFALAIVTIVVIAAVGLIWYTGLQGWRRPRGFLSYHHSDSELADAICTSLGDVGLHVAYLPFGPADHDKVIEETQARIRESDFILAIPGPGGTFADKEIYLASGLGKPVILIASDERARLPDTAYRGYPTFDLPCLLGKKMLPLKVFVEISCGYWRQSWRSLLQSSGHSYTKTFSVLFGLIVVSKFIDGMFVFFPTFTMNAQVYLTAAYLGILNTAVAIGSFAAVKDRVAATSIVRQKIKTGEATYEMLEDILRKAPKDQSVLRCLRRGLDSKSA